MITCHFQATSVWSNEQLLSIFEQIGNSFNTSWSSRNAYFLFNYHFACFLNHHHYHNSFNQEMMTTRNVFIANLAISDILLCLFTIPLALVDIITAYWNFGQDMVRHLLTWWCCCVCLLLSCVEKIVIVKVFKCSHKSERSCCSWIKTKSQEILCKLIGTTQTTCVFFSSFSTLLIAVSTKDFRIPYILTTSGLTTGCQFWGRQSWVYQLYILTTPIYLNHMILKCQLFVVLIIVLGIWVVLWGQTRILTIFLNLKSIDHSLSG